MTRWPQSATTRSFACSRRAYSKASCERQLHVPRAPEDDDRAGDRRELAARVVGGHRQRRRSRVRVLALRGEQPVRRLGAQRGCVGDEPGPEERAPVPGALREAMAERATRRPGRIVAVASRSAWAARVDDAIPAGEASNRPRTSSGRLLREPQRDEAAERVARDERRVDAFRFEHRCRRVGEVGHRGASRRRGRARMPGQIDRDDAVALDQSRQHLDPVAAEPASPWSSSSGSPAPPTWYSSGSSSLVSRVVAAVIRAKYPSLTMATSGTRAR